MRKVIGQDQAGIVILEPKNLIKTPALNKDRSDLCIDSEIGDYFGYRWTSCMNDLYECEGHSVIYIENNKVVKQNYIFEGKKAGE